MKIYYIEYDRNDRSFRISFNTSYKSLKDVLNVIKCGFIKNMHDKILIEYYKYGEYFKFDFITSLNKNMLNDVKQTKYKKFLELK